ncbi:MAG TPA: Hsp33 family molecular chaperone HslO [Clostridiaceae bacterium]|nr:Hsp33 family molecular chaperone HslO [Clostridiaceae bacterium]
MRDYLVRATANNTTIRAFATVTTETVQKAHLIHETSHVASAALGRTLTAAVMMGGMMKDEGNSVTIQIKGDGPLGGIVVVSDSKLNVRGYVYNPAVDLPLNDLGKLDVASAVGKNGYMNVIKDLGLKEPYIGYVNLVSGEIGEDIAYYFAFSEQIPSVVSLGVLVDADGSIINAGGYIIQLLPGADEGVIDFLENKIRTVKPVTALLSEGKSPEDILDIILGEKGLEILETAPCSYTCNCSRDRMERNLLSLGEKEIMEMIEEQHGAELSCHFCNNKYYFTEEQLLNLIHQGKEG